MLADTYNIMIDRGIGAPRNDRDAVNGLNTTKKRFLFMLMKTVHLPGSTAYDY